MIIPTQFYPPSLRGDFLLKIEDFVGCATVYNHSYGGERYTVGTPWCDVDSSGSWGEGGRELASPSANQRKETRRDRGGSEREGENRRTGGREGGRERGQVMKRAVCKKVSTPSSSPVLARVSLPETSLGPNPLITGTLSADSMLRCFRSFSSRERQILQSQLHW